MTTYLVRAVGAWLLFCLSVVCWPDVAFGEFINQELKNGLTMPDNIVNDLRVKFTKPLEKDEQGNFRKPTLKNALGQQAMADAISADGQTATFNQGNVPGTFINPGEVVTIRFGAPAGTKVDKPASTWTKNGEPFADSVATVGQAPTMSFDGLLAFATFVNPEPFGVIYSNIRLYRDNEIGNFTLEQFDIPTGILVTGLPSSVILQPGESVTLSFGDEINFPAYPLALADAAATSTRTDLFAVGAAALPDPPFAAFTAEVEIELGPRTGDDDFKVKGSFTLGAASNGIHPLTEDVTLTVGTFSTTIPAGSFIQDTQGRFKFEGVIDGVALEVVIRPLGDHSFEFKAKGEGADLTGTENPVTVGLTIRDDSGSTTVTAEFE